MKITVTGGPVPPLYLHALAIKAADRSAARGERSKAAYAYQFFVMRSPNRRGSVVKTLVVSPVSSEFRNAPVMAVVLNTFFM